MATAYFLSVTTQDGRSTTSVYHTRDAARRAFRQTVGNSAACRAAQLYARLPDDSNLTLGHWLRPW